VPVELNWKQIESTHRALGEDGTLLLHLLTDQPVSIEALDMVTVADPYPVDEPPNNGGWFEGPTGYLILVETNPDPQLWEWIIRLAGRLSAKGLEGTLTGARHAGRVEWAQPIEDGVLQGHRQLFGMLAYQPLPSSTTYGQGWTAGLATLESVLDHGLGWTFADADRIHVWMGNSDIAADQISARTLFERHVRQEFSGMVTGYARTLQRVRYMGFSAPSAVDMCQYGLGPDTVWDMVRDMTQQILTAPRDTLALARVDLYGWLTILNNRDWFGHDCRAFELYPDRWNEWTPDPCGIQILSKAHLAKTHDLSDWHVTELDPEHWLVEAKDLVPWYTNFSFQDPMAHHCDSETLAKARRDFGDVILTHDKAEEFGLTTRPRPEPAR
jgi:hypothetical protein